MTKSSLKVCYVLSYRDPRYIRTRVLISSLQNLDDVELLTAINTRQGFIRYLETLLRAAYIRIKHNPDIFILGFRGQEIFWPIRFIALGKKLIFDEFIVMYDWFVNEKKLIKNPVLKKLMYKYNQTILHYSDLILEDTQEGVKFSSGLFSINPKKYRCIYVGTDEETFSPTEREKSKHFEVLFYGTMLPLHGVELIIAAAAKLREKPITFTIIGGANNPALVKRIKSELKKYNSKNVNYLTWVDFEELPQYINRADLCLGGPFGDTSQSYRVITGKTFQFMAMGKPTLVCNISEETGFVDKENVLICKRGSSESIALSIEWAYKNQRKLESIGREGQKLFSRKFSSQKIKKSLEEALSIYF